MSVAFVYANKPVLAVRSKFIFGSKCLRHLYCRDGQEFTIGEVQISYGKYSIQKPKAFGDKDSNGNISERWSFAAVQMPMAFGPKDHLSHLTNLCFHNFISLETNVFSPYYDRLPSV